MTSGAIVCIRDMVPYVQFNPTNLLAKHSGEIYGGSNFRGVQIVK